MNFCKNYLSCWWAIFSTLREYEYHNLSKSLVRVVSLFLQVFIPIYRGFETRWELASSSTCLDWSFDSSPLIFYLIWRLSYEKQFQIHSHKKGTMSANIAVILVLYRRHTAEMVVAETCADLVVVHFVHSTLSTLFSLWWNGFWWTCFWRSSFWWRHLQELFLQTHYASDDITFRSAFNQMLFKLQIKFICSLIHSIRTSMNKSLIMVLYTWIRF